MPRKEFVAFTRLDASDVNTFLVNNGYQLFQTIYYTSSGTFTKATYPELRAIKVCTQAGGGGGGGAVTTGSAQNSIGGPGGGGAYAESFITNIAAVGTSVTVTVGAGGTGGALGGNGGNGGASSFGTAVSANGGFPGNGGGAAALTNFSLAGPEQKTATGDLIIPGGAGIASQYLFASFTFPAISGSSFMSTPVTGPATGTGANGSVGNNFGGGGAAGGNAQNQATARSGGAGAPGIVIVELYA